MTGTSPALTLARQRAFLEQLANLGSVKHACAAVDVAPSTAYNWRRSSSAFRALWDEAIDHAGQVLEEEARRRAVDGWDEPVFQRGELVGHVRRYSDRLLEVLLRGAMPEKYRERVEHSAAPVDIASAMLAARGRVGQGPAPAVVEVSPEQRAEALADLRERLEH